MGILPRGILRKQYAVAPEGNMRQIISSGGLTDGYHPSIMEIYAIIMDENNLNLYLIFEL